MRAAVAGRGARLLTTADFRGQTTGESRSRRCWTGSRSVRRSARILDDAPYPASSPCRPTCPATTSAISVTGSRWPMGWKPAAVPRQPRCRSSLAPARRISSAEWREQTDPARIACAHASEGSAAAQARFPDAVHSIPRSHGSSLSRRWLSKDAARRVGIFKPSALAAAQLLAAAGLGNTSLAFYLSSYLTMAISAHLVIDLFCERFQENLARRSAMSLDELRRRIGRDNRRLGASAA